MVSIDARTVEIDDATLVAATLSGGALPARVTVENRLDGPVWPPRRTGIPEAGWDEAGYEGIVPAEATVAIGYACPAPPAEPPVEIVAQEGVDDVEAADGSFDSAESVLRGLGSPAPPREAVPVAADVDRREEERECTEPDSSSNGHARGAGGPDPEGARAAGHEASTSASSTAESSPDGCTRAVAPDLPDPVAHWLDRVEVWIERAERVGAAEKERVETTAPTAERSPASARAIEEGRRKVAARLREVTKRANALSDRAERAAISLDPVERQE